MQTWEQVIILIGLLFLSWWGIRTVKRNPDLFSKENLSKSFFTMGVLAIMLVALIALCIWILRTS